MTMRPRDFSAPLYQQVYPPSATTIEPVIKLAASEAKNNTTAAISSTSPIRPIGVLLIQVSNIALFCFAYAVIGVLI
jgi:hypothetical protein